MDNFIAKFQLNFIDDSIWDTVYALYQWFGVRADGSHKVSRYTTPGTGTEWVEKARDRYGDRWAELVQKSFTEGLK